MNVARPLVASHSAPDLEALLDHSSTSSPPELFLPQFSPKPSESIGAGPLLLFLIYLCFGAAIYSFNRDQFSGGVDTHPVIDAFYFCIVTMCTIGYGDITPLTPFTKVFACFFVVVGFVFLAILHTGFANRVLDLLESMILAGMGKGGNVGHQNFIVDVAKGRMRTRFKVCVAVGLMFLSMGVGSSVLHFVEEFNWVDSVYIAFMSVTTVGYGDGAFKTTGGRRFAAVWLLLSTLLLVRVFLYLAEARIAKRHHKIVYEISQRDITTHHLLSADMDNTGFISKSEYLIYKLKQMGKIGEEGIRQICVRFDSLDHHQSGKITLPDLFDTL